MQHPPADSESFDPRQPHSTGDVTAAATGDAAFPDHAGLDIDDPWRPPAPPRSLGNRWPGGLSQVSETLEVIALAILMFMAVRAVGQNFIVDGRSMEPTFLNAELLIVNRVAYLDVDLSWAPGVETEHWRPFGEPEQGDVVVFIYPGDLVNERDFIKRVIALPGQTVEIRDGTAIVDGVTLVEPYLGEDWIGDLAPQVVPEGHLFVMGDNRRNSSDSRTWGMLDQQLLIGRVDLRYWPFDRMGLVDHDRPDSAATAGVSAAP
ncbi:MAG: signal peptidase I [Dehalococcoidia bacterium]|jgi:signal peptidase I|nr:signal peptidase I [Dehalococcoidia bacterium]